MNIDLWTPRECAAYRRCSLRTLDRERERGYGCRRIMPTAVWVEPPHLWFALIDAPSTGKTPAIQPVTKASGKLERDDEPAWRTALAKYERDAEAAKAANEIWRDEVRKVAKQKKPAK